MCGNPYYFERDEQPNEVCIEVNSPRPSRDHYWFNNEWVIGGFMDQSGNYYEGALQYGDQVVPKRPSYLHVWNGTEWVFNNSESLAEIRQKRDSLLKECDFVDLPNTPLDPEVKAQWISYRQALRDFPENCDPVNPVWPEQPEYIKA